MAQTFTCPQGHQWEDTFGDFSLAPGAPMVCPVCGAVTERESTSTQSMARPAPRDFPRDEVPTQATAVPNNFKIELAGPLPEIVGYEILGELGRGGMGVVYKARQIKLKRIVALKMILAGGAAGREGLARFLAEAEAVARLQHPNIVQIYEIGEHNNLPFFSMEFVEWGNLIQKMAAKPFTARESAQLVATLGRAMHFAHERNIIHRDLKPGNILITRDGSPKITDFGLAKRLDDAVQYTKSGEIMGTPSYMAPEQAEGRQRDIGPHTDVYALGAILYELLTARPPFKAETVMDTLLQVLYEDPVSPRRLLPKLSRDLETICLKALYKDHTRRYPTGLALANDLERFLAGEPILARPVTTRERVVKWARRRPALAALVLVSGLALFGLLVLSLWFNVEQQRWMAQERSLNQQLAEAAEGERRKAKEADEQRSKAEKLKGIAEEQKALAEKQSIRAEENFQRARAAVREMLYEVAQSDLANVPLMEGVRQKLAAKALQFNRDFLTMKSKEPGIRKEAGEAFQQVGEIQRLLGKRTEAVKAYDESIALFQALAAEFPQQPGYARELANSHFYRGQLERELLDPKKAQTSFGEALKIQEKLVADYPHNPDHRRLLARTWNDLALTLQHLKQPDAARAAYDKALALQVQLVMDWPDGKPEYREELGGSYNDLGRLLRATGQPEKAKETYQKALAELQVLVLRHKEVQGYRQKLAATENNLGNALLDLQQPKPALEVLRTSLADREQLAKDYPSVLLYRQEVAETHNNLARALAADNRAADAEKEYEESLRIQRKLAADHPTVPQYRSRLGAMLDNVAAFHKEKKEGVPRALALLEEATKYHDEIRKSYPDDLDFRKLQRNHYDILAETLLRCEPPRYVEAAAAAVELPKLAPENAGDYERTATLLARCLIHAEKDPKLPLPEKIKLARDYADRSMAMLQEAVQHGFINGVRLKTSATYVPLRGREDFKKLLAEVEKKSP